VLFIIGRYLFKDYVNDLISKSDGSAVWKGLMKYMGKDWSLYLSLWLSVCVCLCLCRVLLPLPSPLPLPLPLRLCVCVRMCVCEGGVWGGVGQDAVFAWFSKAYEKMLCSQGRTSACPCHAAAIKALFRLYSGSIKALPWRY
jgi:hypothetical protein